MFDWRELHMNFVHIRYTYAVVRIIEKTKTKSEPSVRKIFKVLTDKKLNKSAEYHGNVVKYRALDGKLSLRSVTSNESSFDEIGRDERGMKQKSVYGFL